MSGRTDPGTIVCLCYRSDRTDPVSEANDDVSGRSPVDVSNRIELSGTVTHNRVMETSHIEVAKDGDR